MAQKEKKAKKARAHKTSSGVNRGAKPTHLTDVQKILICNGGMGHKYLRQGVGRFRFAGSPKRKGGRGRQEAS